LGFTQQAFAERLKISLPTAKRWLSGHGVTLDNLDLMLRELGLSPQSIGEALAGEELGSFYYTKEQEQLFVKHPSALALYEFLRKGKTLSELQHAHEVSERTIRELSKMLENVGLIKRLAFDKIHVVHKGEPTWRKHGLLQLRLRHLALQEFVKIFEPAQRHDHPIKFFISHLSAEDIGALKVKMDEFCQFLEFLEARSKLKNNTTRKETGILFAIAPFCFSALNKIEEI
jgi:transcriptional regulator with XRE-family HTH domain